MGPALLSQGMSMNNEPARRVVVTDIKMPFFSMVAFMVKWAIASIPAFIILSVIGALIAAVITGLFGGGGHIGGHHYSL